MKLADIEVTLKHETPKAYLLESHTTGEQAWVPKSIVELDLKPDNTAIATLPENIATEKGLI